MLPNAQTEPTHVEYTIPGGCVGCGADLPVRVTPRGARGVCKACGWFAKPTLTVTARGLVVNFEREFKA